ncbi:trypsin-1-like [Pecten maximus]|uniref:trypsin-1-like n=1 Tax=Pecten maximus TaxID=6579 RepID=UPI0014587141|nr:trypsin-1-like [Pecten maximus]
MFVPIILACIVAVFGRHHHGVVSHGHYHHQQPSGVHQTDSISPLIVGGTRADPKDWPWQATLSMSNQLFCGGSLIKPHPAGEYFVLTAAHCVDGANQVFMNVTFGQTFYEYNRNHDIQTVGVSEIIMHKDYNRRTLENDVALLRLSPQPDVTSEHVKIGPVQLPSVGDGFRRDAMVWVTGFGTTSSGGGTPEYLMQVEKPYVTDEECKNSYGQDFDAGFHDVCRRGGKRCLSGRFRWSSCIRRRHKFSS